MVSQEREEEKVENITRRAMCLNAQNTQCFYQSFFEFIEHNL